MPIWGGSKPGTDSIIVSFPRLRPFDLVMLGGRTVKFSVENRRRSTLRTLTAGRDIFSCSPRNRQGRVWGLTTSIGSQPPVVHLALMASVGLPHGSLGPSRRPRAGRKTRGSDQYVRILANSGMYIWRGKSKATKK